MSDDPIVFPGQPGASHLHDFFGNTGANASSTFETMLAGETTCRVPSDKLRDDGALLWFKQFGSESDGFLRTYLPNGTQVWTRQFGTTDYDAVYGMASEPKGVVAVGTTHGAFEGQTNAGDRDVFLVRIAFS